MLDLGIWPESKIFNDQGFGPPPKRWKAFVKNSPISLAKNKYLYNHHILTYMHININIRILNFLNER